MKGRNSKKPVDGANPKKGSERKGKTLIKAAAMLLLLISVVTIVFIKQFEKPELIIVALVIPAIENLLAMVYFDSIRPSHEEILREMGKCLTLAANFCICSSGGSGEVYVMLCWAFMFWGILLEMGLGVGHIFIVLFYSFGALFNVDRLSKNNPEYPPRRELCFFIITFVCMALVFLFAYYYEQSRDSSTVEDVVDGRVKNGDVVLRTKKVK